MWEQWISTFHSTTKPKQNRDPAPPRPSDVAAWRGPLIKKTIWELFQLGKSKVYQGSVDFTAHNDSECNHNVKRSNGKPPKFLLGGPMATRCVSLQVFFFRVQKAGCVNRYLLDAPAVYQAPLHLCTQLQFGERRGSGNKPQALAHSCSLVAKQVRSLSLGWSSIIPFLCQGVGLATLNPIGEKNNNYKKYIYLNI